MDYELIDLGEGRKLERFGDHILDRPEVEAKGQKNNSKEWSKADYYFWEERGKKGQWRKVGVKEKSWNIRYSDRDIQCQFSLELSNYKHIGLFPEQTANWKYISERIKQMKSCRFLNLFAYTSAASIIASKAGAEVVNVEALKQLTNWSKKNADLNKVNNVQWLTEDARTYVDRAARRKDKFQGILLDPPAFGHANKGKRWIIERDLHPLMQSIQKIMDPSSCFMIINTYSPKMSLSQVDSLLLKMGLERSSFKNGNLGLESSSNKALILGNLHRFSNF